MTLARTEPDESAIGFAFDGTGYGSDGAVWGGEVLIANYKSFRRAAHLRYVPLAGGNASVSRPYRMALSHLSAAAVAWDERLPTGPGLSLRRAKSAGESVCEWFWHRPHLKHGQAV